MSEADTRLSGPNRLCSADNYHAWKSRVYNILKGKGLEDYIEATCIKPEPIKSSPSTPSSSSTAPLGAPATVESASQATRLHEIKQWKANNGRAKTTIQANCTQEPNDLIVDISTASEM